MAEKIRKIALLGNPNAGKSSLFNQLTGMRQKVGNFPGVTVERKSAFIKLENKQEVEIIDLPGTYSLYPTSMDERIAVSALIDISNKDYPDAIIYIIDVTQLERHLLLLTQIMDLGFPIIVALNMNDIAATQNVQCDEQKLAAQLGLDIIKVNGRTGDGINTIKSKLSALSSENSIKKYNASFFTLSDDEMKISEEVRKTFPVRNNYHALLLLQHYKKSSFLSSNQKTILAAIVQQQQFDLLDHQLEEIMQRYNRFTPIVAKVLRRTIVEAKTLTDKVDTIITHKVFGPLIFFTIMLFIFQAIFSWSSIPMDWIDGEFAKMATYFHTILPNNLFTRLLTEGLIPGISGVLVFVPQITILFLLITILEEVGYMSRVVYMFDNIMQRFGLNGRSIVALISGGACAVPAIMSTRTISNWKERLITIMVTPLISCSARIPVFAVLIGFVVPEIKIGIFNARGLVFMALYLIGILAALTASYVFKLILKSDEYSFLMLELPEYRKPHWRNVFHTLYVKVRSFVFGAGKIILLVSLVLWFLASFGPSKAMQQAEQEAKTEAVSAKLDAENTSLLIASKKLEASYAGTAGR